MIINHFFFYFERSFAQQFFLFDIRKTQDISKGGNWEQQIARNSRLQYLFQK